MSVSNERQALRNAGRAERNSIAGSVRTAAEASLVRHLQSLDELAAPIVGVFIAHDGEPDLQGLIDWIWDSGRCVALPVLRDDPDDFTMRFVPWHRGDELMVGRYAIPVPPSASAVAPSTLVVSLTGFDSAGNRIGRGGGFFDRYLASTDAQIVGVGFEAQRFPTIPTEAHDVSMPVMVTELGVRFHRTRTI